MQMQIQLKTTSALDKRNARIVLSTQQLLQEGKTTDACNEIRKLERRVASHPAVVQLRRNLVASLYGWEYEDTAISRLQPAPAVNGHGTPGANGNGMVSVNGNGNGESAASHNGNGNGHIEQAAA